MMNRLSFLAIPAITLFSLVLGGCGQGGETASGDGQLSSEATILEEPGVEPSAAAESASETDFDSAPDPEAESSSQETLSNESDTASLIGQAPALPPAQGIDDLEAEAEQRAALTPISLSIERLGLIETPVRPEGLDEKGDMAVPPPKEVGWYRYGSAPGEAGSAVLAGHIASDGIDGAFRHLNRMEVGDEVVVNRTDGTSITFAVTELVQVNKTELPFDEVFSRSGPTKLALITCGGEFDYSVRSYKDNVIVIAEPVDA